MEPLFNAHNPRRISDAEINWKDIQELGRKLGFTAPGARYEFEKMLNKAQVGGITREEVHEILQDLILKGKITKDQAMRMATALGLTRKDFRLFKDISESRFSRLNQNSSSQIGKQESEKPMNLEEESKRKLLELRRRDNKDLKARLDNKKTPDGEISAPASNRGFTGHIYQKPGSADDEPEGHWRTAA